MNKKRWLVIAIALFLVIGTGSFVFANPSDTSLNGKGTKDPNSSSQPNSSNSSGTKDNNNTIQNDGSFNTGENDADGENIIVNGDLNSNTMGNPINGNTTTNTSQNNNNNAGQNNPSNIVNGGNNSPSSSGNNGNTNNDNDNNNNGNTGGGNSGGSSNPGNKPTEPENPDVVDPSPSTPDDEKPTSNFVFANQKPFTENKIEIQDENYVSMTVRNLSKTNDKGYTTTDRVVEINEYDTFKFTVCYRNLPTCQIYIMTHVR